MDTHAVCLWLPNRLLRTLTLVKLVVVLLTLPPGSGRDVNPQKEKYLPDYLVYHNLSRIQADIESIAYRNPLYMKVRK